MPRGLEEFQDLPGLHPQVFGELLDFYAACLRGSDVELLLLYELKLES